MTDREVLKLALEALVDLGWHNENCPQFPTWAEPKKHPSCTCGYDTAITALRQALDHVPDATKMIEPDMGIDRGAWSDVPDATKWVDELRGDEEPPNSTTDVVETEKPCGWVNENGIFAKQLPDDLVYSWKPVYIAPPEARQDKA